MCGGPLKCGDPCSAEHVRTLVNPALTIDERHIFLCEFTAVQGRYLTY